MNCARLIFLFLVFAVDFCFAVKPKLNSSAATPTLLPPCDNERAVILRARSSEWQGGFKSIPKGTVAREARFYVETNDAKGSIVKIMTFQSFVHLKETSKAKVVCASAGSPLQSRFSMMAPTLVQNGPDTKPANIFWQFQILADHTVLSSWNTKSLALSAKDDIDKTVTDLGYETKIFSLNFHQFEVVYTQRSADSRQILSIIYDLI